MKQDRLRYQEQFEDTKRLIRNGTIHTYDLSFLTGSKMKNQMTSRNYFSISHFVIYNVSLFVRLIVFIELY